MWRPETLLTALALLHSASAGVIYIYTSSYLYTECSNNVVNPYPVPNDVGDALPGLKEGTDPRLYKYIQADGSTRNAILLPADKVPTTCQMDIFDAYYNGTYSFTLTPPNGNSSCPKLESQTLTNQYLRIGPSARDGVSRIGFDKNPYYFRFGTGLADNYRCPFAANKAFIGFQSSNDDLTVSQPWTLDAPQLNSGQWSLTGKLAQVEASFGNFMHYTVNTTGSDRDYPKACFDQFSQHALTARDSVVMSASIGAGDAKMDFSFTDSITGYAVKGAFAGKAWDKGAKLVMSGDQIATMGAAKRVKPTDNVSNGTRKIIIICVVIVVVCLFFSCGWFCCCKRSCCRSSKLKGAM